MAAGASALLLSACASDEPDPTDSGTPTADAPADTDTSVDDDASDEADEQADDTSDSGSEVEADDDRPALEGPAAPDFTLALADGSEFVLSAEQRTTFLVFWAEW